MLLIRDKQLKIFQANEMRKFEERVLGHIKECFPEHYENMGAEKNKQLVRDAVKRASRYGLDSQRDVTLFLDLMFSLGIDFDQDPDLPWVAEILNDEFVPNPSDRLDILYERVFEYLHGDDTGQTGRHE